MKELREQLYAMMNEATDEIGRRTPEACNTMLGTDTWKSYRDAETAAGEAIDTKSLHNHIQRMRHLLSQINTL